MVTLGNIGDTIKSGAESLLDSSRKNEPLNSDNLNNLRNEGFLLPPAYSADGNGLPSNKVPTQHDGKLKRNIITWFVPEFGTVRMYVNPSSISYRYEKTITKERTKGGFSLQYWGEELPELSISGTTGSAGIEGINVLYEIYRAEQYAFDGVGLTLAANNANNDLAGNLMNSIENSGVFGSVLGGVLGFDSPKATLASKNVPSLAQLAFTVEMYYNGIVYRGYFKNMTVNEKSDSFLLEYAMTFVVTQTRGYRTNYFPWSRSANNGPSAINTPHSFNNNLNISNVNPDISDLQKQSNSFNNE